MRCAPCEQKEETEMLNPNFIEHFPEDHEYYTDTQLVSSNHRWDCVLTYADKYCLQTKESTILHLPGVIKSAVFHTYSGGITLTMENDTVEETHIECFDDYLCEHDLPWEGWQVQTRAIVDLQVVREQRKG
jgi:hypothetical protein